MGSNQGGIRLLRETPSPHPTSPDSIHWICVFFLFFALVYTKKPITKNKAILIKLSAGLSPDPTAMCRWFGGGCTETGRGRESPSPHTRGVSQERFSGVSWGSCGAGTGCKGAAPRAPQEGDKAN